MARRPNSNPSATALVPLSQLIEARGGTPPPKAADWLVCDRSGSMASQLPGSELTRIGALKKAVESFGDAVQVMFFGHGASYGSPVEVYDRTSGTEAFEAGGGTPMAEGLTAVTEFEPSYVILLSDGVPNDPAAAKSAAARVALTAIIDTMYIGPDDPSAEGLMRAIAEIGSGRYKRFDVTKPQQLSLTQAIQGLLPAPDEIKL